MKLYLAHCSKTGKRFCLEGREKGGRVEIVNFLDISDADAKKIPLTNPPKGLATARNLLPCSSCGSRLIAGCSCASSTGCRATDSFKLGCAYCNQLVIDRPKPKIPKIYVTESGYDNIGAVLDGMKLPYSKFNGNYDCDILFINCGTPDSIDTQKLRAYVHSGGCVYISDLASGYLSTAFPGIIEFENDTEPCKIYARVVDPELHQIVGNRIEIEFDLDSWSLMVRTPLLAKFKGKVLLEAQGVRYGGKPIMICFDYGAGKVFYTSFHNHAQASEKETMLLELLLLKQIGSKSNQTVEEVGELMGLNIGSMKAKFRK